MNIIDLFAGSGGLSEGFRSEKFNILLHVEMDKDAAQTLKTREIYYHLKAFSRLDIYSEYISQDISKTDLQRNIPSEPLDRVLNVEISEETIQDIFDLLDSRLLNEKLHGIVGGPPCQAFSLIGRAKNSAKKDKDERIYLYQYYVQFLNKYSPLFFIFENVKGLKSFRDSHNELLLPKIISAFNSAGYNVCDEIINASHYGVPQSRERLFLYGYRNDISPHDFFMALESEKEKPVSVNSLFHDMPLLYAGSQIDMYRSECECEFVRKHIRTQNLPLTQNIARPHRVQDLEIYKLVLKEKLKGRQIRYDELPNHLQSHRNTDGFTDRYKAIDGTGLSHTIVAHISKDGNYYIHPDINQNRSITVREAARIQTFPDDYYFEGSRSSIFRQIGNAVPPVLSKKIARTIVETMKSVIE